MTTPYPFPTPVALSVPPAIEILAPIWTVTVPVRPPAFVTVSWLLPIFSLELVMAPRLDGDRSTRCLCVSLAGAQARAIGYPRLNIAATVEHPPAKPHEFRPGAGQPVPFERPAGPRGRGGLMLCQ
jgi:hypothetical protein